MYKPRTTAPSTTDKNYLHTSKGGYNKCILISGSSCLPNCVGYAWGRWREILGKSHKLSLNNAEVWYMNTKDGYERGSTPKLGAVICWRKGVAGNGDDGAGHVAIVEKINSDGSIVTSNSAYGGSRFYTKTLKKPYSLGGSYVLQGFIYLPVSFEVTPAVKRDKTKNQLQVNTNELRVRSSATTKKDNIIGFAKNKGIYNYYESKTADGYTWYRIADGQWLAKIEEVVVYPKEEKTAEEVEMEELKKTIEEQKLEIEKLKKELEKYSGLKEFTSTETGYWKIYLKVDDKIYF